MFYVSVSQRDNVYHDKNLHKNLDYLSGYGLITWGERKAIIDAFSFLRPSITNSKSDLIHTLKETKLELCMEIDCYIIQTFILSCDSTITRMNALKKLLEF